MSWKEFCLTYVAACYLGPFLFLPRTSLTRSGVSSFHRKANTPLTPWDFCCCYHTDPWDSGAHSCCLATQTDKVSSGCALRCQPVPCWLVYGEWEMGEWQWDAAGEERQWGVWSKAGLEVLPERIVCQPLPHHLWFSSFKLVGSLNYFFRSFKLLGFFKWHFNKVFMIRIPVSFWSYCWVSSSHPQRLFDLMFL